MIVLRRRVSLGVSVVTTILFAAGVVQEVRVFGVPSTSTMQRRQALNGCNRSSWHIVGMYISASRHTSRIVCP